MTRRLLNTGAEVCKLLLVMPNTWCHQPLFETEPTGDTP
jgi:hypothetical protein